ncbi:MAG: hypothetical protein JSU85_14905 [Candidatus Zixiibacteriota bacterium]|nr:MAG: hypothetical protein JSU85_14905 [candidate division Zixibacteria bacterium]
MKKLKYPAGFIYVFLFLAICFSACAKTGDQSQQTGQMSMLEDVKADKTPDSLQLRALPDEPESEKDVRAEQLSLMEEDLKYKTGTKETPIIRKKIKPSPLPEEPRGK